MSASKTSRPVRIGIIGSGAGSLLTGFLFMEWMGLHLLSILLLVVSWLWVALSSLQTSLVRSFVT